MKRQERTAAPAISIQRIHLAFKTHLDVGYTDLAREVAKRYFDLYVPRAIRLAQTLRQAGGEARFVWTTGSWLIYEYLERASPNDRARMEQAILDGDIAWHGLPFTVFSELMDDELWIETLDAPLIAPGERSLLKFDNRPPPLKRGIHFALFNNVWGTNFPMWYDDNARFRFILRFKERRPGANSA